MENPPPYAIDSVDNALRLLLVLRRDGLLRVSTAADELGVARSTAHRLLAMLKYRGFVVQDAERRYRPGPALRESDPGVAAITLPGLARPHMQRLAEQVGETVHLLTRHLTSVRFVESVECTAALRVGSRVGASLPAHRTSGGKVLLAELSRKEVDELYADVPLSADERTHFHRQLSTVRRRGFGTNLEESEAGVVAVAVCIREADAAAVAAMSVSAPTVRYGRAQILDLVPPLRAAAENIRRKLIGG